MGGQGGRDVRARGDARARSPRLLEEAAGRQPRPRRFALRCAAAPPFVPAVPRSRIGQVRVPLGPQWLFLPSARRLPLSAALRAPGRGGTGWLSRAPSSPGRPRLSLAALGAPPTAAVPPRTPPPSPVTPLHPVAPPPPFRSLASASGVLRAGSPRPRALAPRSHGPLPKCVSPSLPYAPIGRPTDADAPLPSPPHTTHCQETNLCALPARRFSADAGPAGASRVADHGCADSGRSRGQKLSPSRPDRAALAPVRAGLTHARPGLAPAPPPGARPLRAQSGRSGLGAGPRGERRQGGVGRAGALDSPARGREEMDRSCGRGVKGRERRTRAPASAGWRVGGGGEASARWRVSRRGSLGGQGAGGRRAHCARKLTLSAP